jgi:hypothetical protein
VAAIPFQGMELEVLVRHSAGWRLELPDQPPSRGDRSGNLKILDARPEGGLLAVELEGLAGKTYRIGVRRPDGRLVSEVIVVPRDTTDARDGYVRLERRVGRM